MLGPSLDAKISTVETGFMLCNITMQITASILGLYTLAIEQLVRSKVKKKGDSNIILGYVMIGILTGKSEKHSYIYM